MRDTSDNYSNDDVEMTFERYRPTDKFLLTLDTLHANFSAILTLNQVAQLRLVLSGGKCGVCEKSLEEEKAVAECDNGVFSLKCSACSTKGI